MKPGGRCGGGGCGGAVCGGCSGGGGSGGGDSYGGSCTSWSMYLDRTPSTVSNEYIEAFPQNTLGCSCARVAKTVCQARATSIGWRRKEEGSSTERGYMRGLVSAVVVAVAVMVMGVGWLSCLLIVVTCLYAKYGFHHCGKALRKNTLGKTHCGFCVLGFAQIAVEHIHPASAGAGNKKGRLRNGDRHPVWCLLWSMR